jgi:hypothetical protein
VIVIIGRGMIVGVGDGGDVGVGGSVDVGDGSSVTIGSNVGRGVSLASNSGVSLAWGDCVGGEGITKQAMAMNVLEMMNTIRNGFFMSSPPWDVSPRSHAC